MAQRIPRAWMPYLATVLAVAAASLIKRGMQTLRELLGEGQ